MVKGGSVCPSHLTPYAALPMLVSRIPACSDGGNRRAGDETDTFCDTVAKATVKIPLCKGVTAQKTNTVVRDADATAHSLVFLVSKVPLLGGGCNLRTSF